MPSSEQETHMSDQSDGPVTWTFTRDELVEALRATDAAPLAFFGDDGAVVVPAEAYADALIETLTARRL
jgi:hypothetical protein